MQHFNWRVTTARCCHRYLPGQADWKDAYQSFIKWRLLEGCDVNFFDTLPRTKLKSFSSSFNKTVSLSKGKEVILKADRNLFSMMAIIAQTWQLDMREVLAHSLGPIPWALATSSGSLRKTNKAALSTTEKLSVPVEAIPLDSACIIDAMSIIQKGRFNQKTFADVAEVLFQRMLLESQSSSRIDVVFNVYRDKSIKNLERVGERGATMATEFKNIMGSHKLKQWDSFIKAQATMQA